MTPEQSLAHMVKNLDMEVIQCDKLINNARAYIAEEIAEACFLCDENFNREQFLQDCKQDRDSK